MARASDSGDGPVARRVLVIGIDGGTFDLISPMVEDGRLPNLAKLIEEGSSGVLESTIPPVTIPAWVSMMTGKNPGKLGVYDLLRREGYGVEPNVLCYDRKAPLWSVLNKYGVRTGMMNVPGTYPPEEVDGFMISGMMTPSKRSEFSFPSKLARDLDRRVKDYEIDIPQWQYFDEGHFVKDVYKVTEKRAAAAEYLLEAIPCDFNMVVFTSSDRLQHVLWNKRKVIEEYWEKLDEAIGRVLRRFGEETTIFVVSDHGFGPVRRTFYVNEWLRSRGYLRTKAGIGDSLRVRMGRLVEGGFRKLGEMRLLKVITAFLDRLMGFERIRRYTYSYLSNERLETRVAWRRTKAFSCVHTPHFGNIYLNLRGGMRRGCVRKGERKRIRDAIMEDLRGLTDPEAGAALKVRVYAPEEVYSGPYVDEAPDIVFTLEDGTYEFDAKVGEGRLFEDGAPLTGWTGTHLMDGIFIARGPNIRRGLSLEGARIMDVAPTIMRVFGVPPPGEVDGRVLEEIFVEGEDYRERPALNGFDAGEAREGGLSEEDKALIEARLRRLGYIS